MCLIVHLSMYEISDIYYIITVELFSVPVGTSISIEINNGK